MSAPRRVGVFTPYWSFWEPSAVIDLRADRLGLLRRAAALVEAAGFEAVAPALVEGVATAEAAAARWRKAGCDSLLAVVSMAAPPTTALAAIDAMPETPLVIWTVQRGGIGGHTSMSDIVVDGGTVGTPQITNVLVRSGRSFGLVVGPEQAPSLRDELADALRAATLASELRGARIARLGTPLEGYLCVDAPDEALEGTLGVEILHLEPTELRERYLAVGAREAAEARPMLVGSLRVSPELAPDALRDSVRFALALRRLAEDHGIAAGALNCHVAELRFARDPGLTPCFGVGCETTRGTPWTCAGDVLTAIAMLAAKRLSGAAFYHEIEAIDADTGECFLANSGEHDLAWRPPEIDGELVPNPWFARDVRQGACARFPLPSGLATLVAVTVADDEPGSLRMIAAQGAVTGSRFPRNPTSGGGFRFADPAPPAAWKRWVAAGANHHGALARGHVADLLGLLARFRGIGYRQVS